MPSQAVQPLRIQKNTPSSSPTKMTGRPLSELSPLERRRNSPSFNQLTKKIQNFNQHSSPFESSPLNGPNGATSPRQFWQGRDPAVSPSRFDSENYSFRDSSPSPTKRSSIENLKRASRVKNSNMFAREQKQEYDPTSMPVIERPLATGRPLTTQLQGNAYGGKGIEPLRKETSSPSPSKFRIDNSSKIPIASPLKTPTKSMCFGSSAPSPSKESASPMKSSLSNPGRYHALPRSFDPENGTWSDDESGGEKQLPEGRGLHRHAKSVTFDAAPPQVNEYEMATPDLSSVGTSSPHAGYDSAEDDEDDESFERGVSIDRDDSFDASLEDTEKTPVVGPDDWRHMSPGAVNSCLSDDIEDPFGGRDDSPMPAAQPNSSYSRPAQIRTDSINSNGERRPLPPIPGLSGPSRPRSNSNVSDGISATADRISNAHRDLPSLPRPASISKSDIQGMTGSKMSLEDRLRLMMLQDESPKSSSEAQRERRMRRSGSRGRSQSQETEPEAKGLGIQVKEEHKNPHEQVSSQEYQLPPRISRESILRRVKSRSQIFEEPNYNFSSSPAPSSPDRDIIINLDPDVPIPSTEPPSFLEDTETSVIIKQEEDDSEFDVYSIPEMYSFDRSESALGDHEDEYESTPIGKEYDEDMHYSGRSRDQEQSHNSILIEDKEPATPTQTTPNRAAEKKNAAGEPQSHRMSLPEFASLLGDDSFNLGLESYLTPSPPSGTDVPVREISSTTFEAPPTIERPVTPPEQIQQPGYSSDNEEDHKTPDSVIRHPIESPKEESPFVPEPVATIKAHGSRLKTRPSTTPADFAAMAAARRQVSGDRTAGPPPIPERHRDHRFSSVEPGESGETDGKDDDDEEQKLSRKRSLKKLDIPVSGVSDDLSIGLDQEFDRVIEAQKVAYNLSPKSCMLSRDLVSDSKLEPSADIAVRRQRGYLMRQNTKIIVATSTTDELVSTNVDLDENDLRGTRSAGTSPVKASHDRPKSWTVEPWNGKMRRKSVRDGSGTARKRPNGVAPPMPGKESNVTSSLGIVVEDEPAGAEEEGEGVERGRVFVKVIGVKDLDLPLPKAERTWFCLTLDNGLHCVTTAWLELGRNAPIGQEFELVVLNDLEFQLTLQTKIEPPPPQLVQQPPVKAKVHKPSTFSRVFASPKKRKEMERKHQEEERLAREQHEAQSRRVTTQATAWDLLHGLVARDGSFARSYVCLKDYEARAYGRPIITDVTCFNEWATEEPTLGSSVKSARALNGGPQRRPPYRIGKLELQLLFVPKPKGVKDPEMPKSMNACIRELKEAEVTATRKWEGHLSQQGGDCPYWRRRFFKLDGCKLTAYHETTRQPRANINLAKASKLIDDRSSLVQKEVSAKGGRRKSAFAEEEEGYMFVEEGFRIRFANGEVIDFYADSPADKEGWMKVLSETIGKDAGTKGWTEMVLAKERAERERSHRQAVLGGMNASGRHGPPPPIEKSSRHRHGHHHSASVGSTPR